MATQEEKSTQKYVAQLIATTSSQIANHPNKENLTRQDLAGLAINCGTSQRDNSTAGISPTSINFSPLSTAALSNDDDLVKALLEAGANPDHKNQGTMSPKQCAKNNPKILETLEQYKDPKTQQNCLISTINEHRQENKKQNNNINNQSPSNSLQPTEFKQLQSQKSLTGPAV